jgi:hypothetical protein
MATLPLRKAASGEVSVMMKKLFLEREQTPAVK